MRPLRRLALDLILDPTGHVLLGLVAIYAIRRYLLG